MKIENVLIVGAGVMGQQIGLHHAMYGFNVTMFDISDDLLAACKAQQQKYVDSFRETRPSFTDADIEAGLARLSYCSDLETAARNADLVNESVPEVLEIKQKVYADLIHL